MKVSVRTMEVVNGSCTELGMVAIRRIMKNKSKRWEPGPLHTGSRVCLWVKCMLAEMEYQGRNLTLC